MTMAFFYLAHMVTFIFSLSSSCVCVTMSLLSLLGYWDRSSCLTFSCFIDSIRCPQFKSLHMLALWLFNCSASVRMNYFSYIMLMFHCLVRFLSFLGGPNPYSSHLQTNSFERKPSCTTGFGLYEAQSACTVWCGYPGSDHHKLYKVALCGRFSSNADKSILRLQALLL